METCHKERSFLSSIRMSQALITAKPEKLEKWKNHNVKDTVDSKNQEFRTLRCVNLEKSVNGKLKYKPRSVGRGFPEVTSNVLSDFPTCNKDSLCLILNLITTLNWICQSIEIKLTFLQKRVIDRSNR